jgi:hypothetical protein
METFYWSLVALGALFYFLPALIAMNRNCEHSGAISLIDFVFGWTVLGWLAAFIWAVLDQPRPPYQGRSQ